MALDGPDTGNSQWFVNLSPQPHLDGTYTVFGRVVQGDAARSGRPSAAPAAALHRVTRGDRILRIRRVR
jgi:peptidyl-prolyl cis-trans isomerase B (cyclophilin B)